MSNLAKEWQTGTYVVSVYNNRVKVSRPKQGHDKPFVEVEAKCDPEDEFSLSMGVALAMDRLNKELGKNKIGVGDKVRIKDGDFSYIAYIDWIAANVNDVKLAACYDYNAIPETDGEEYIVKAIAPWKNKSGQMLAYIQHYYVFNSGEINDNQPCYLICIDGLEKV